MPIINDKLFPVKVEMIEGQHPEAYHPPPRAIAATVVIEGRVANLERNITALITHYSRWLLDSDSVGWRIDPLKGKIVISFLNHEDALQARLAWSEE